jgi:P63C domain
MRVNRPQVVARYTKDLVYERLLPGILKELEERNPKDERGRRRGRHHQLLTEDGGHPALGQHLYAVITFMRAETDWDEFKRRLDVALPRHGANLKFSFMAD